MALCQYCGKVEVAWQQVDRRWIACAAQVDANGAVVKRPVRSGARVVNRPVPNTAAPHYPIPAGMVGGTYCPDWTAQKAAIKAAGKPKRRPVPPPEAYGYGVGPEVAPAPEAAPCPTCGGGGGVGGCPTCGKNAAPAINPLAVGALTPWAQAPGPVDVDKLKREIRAEVVGVLDEYGIAPPAQCIVVKRPDGAEVKVEGPTHELVPELIETLGRRSHAYLYGAAGAGKTHAAVQALRTLCPDAAILTMPGLTTGKLFGFTDASGRYQGTAFTHAYENGGGIVLDELDRAMPQVASALNSVLENGVAVFNGKQVPVHDTFRLVATGNTDMRGGYRTYTGAQPLDLATAARFEFIYWTYDEALENVLVGGVLPKAAAVKLLAWGRALRATLAQEKQDTVFAGPREMLRMAKAIAAGKTVERAAQGWIWRGLDPAIVRRLTAVHPYPVIPVQG